MSLDRISTVEFSLDDVTSFLRTALKILLVQHPTRTSYGIIGGFVAEFLLDVFRSHIEPFVNFQAFTTLRLCLLSVLLFHSPFIFRKEQFPEDIELLFTAVNKAVMEGSLSPAQKRMLYREIAQRMIQQTKLNPVVEREVKDVEETARESE
jgi:hypothetical protein